MTWVEPTDITAEQDASSSQFNEEVLGNLRYMKTRVDAMTHAQTFTPQLYQNGNRTSSLAIGEYFIDPDGDLCRLHVRMVGSATGSAGNAIEVRGIPAGIAALDTGTPNSGAACSWLGTGCVLDSGSALYYAQCYFVSAQAIRFQWVGHTLGTDIGANPSFALAAGDSLVADIEYPIA